jgi:hypothetical protein
MAKKYLDFDSTYRDRTMFPIPGEFEVPVAPSGLRTAATAVDPVSLSCPILAWSSNRFQANAAVTSSVSGTVIAPGVGATNSKRVVVFTTPAGHLQQKRNYYKHAVLRSVPVNTEYARITDYRYLGNNKAMVKLDTDIVLLPGDAMIIIDPTDFIDPANAILFVPCRFSAENSYCQYIIYNETLGQSRAIDYYDGDTGLLGIGGLPIPLWLPSHNYSLRKEIPSLTTTAGVGSTNNLVVLTGGQPISDIYVGAFIRLLPTAYDNTTQVETRRIVAYDGPTTTATVFPPFSGGTLGLTVEVLPFSYDNFNPFTYTGTQEKTPITFKIKLRSLVVPNQILSVGGGGQIAFYPYIYVELTTNETPVTNVLYSNNPNATRMLFRASIDDIQNLQQSTFISLNGDGTTQEILFKVDTNFKVRVILPNGDVFDTLASETYSPCPPNPLAQISMLFEMERV